MSILFPLLLSTESKNLRLQIYQAIISEIKNSNSKKRDENLNRRVQAILMEIVTDDTSKKGKWAIQICRELWRKEIWRDPKTVLIMRTAALHTNPQIVMGAVRFLLGENDDKKDKENSDNSDYENENAMLEGIEKVKKLKFKAQKSGMSGKKQRQIKKAVALVKKRGKNRGEKKISLNFAAIHILHDPQAFAEQLFHRHLFKKSVLNEEQKLLLLNLLSRLIGSHKLYIEEFYSWILRFLIPRQLEVTKYLVAAAQATHEFVPPEFLMPVTRKIADEFVTGGVSSAVLQTGLNAIREICLRQPESIDTDMLHDLIQYKDNGDSGVSSAARGIISVYRSVAPEMLKRKSFVATPFTALFRS